ncbi:Ig-like domain-containing protein [bacterium]|nr:Ig-like domain-containing protein [bacterium]
MKKLLLVLVVVTMASFLFTGCLLTVPVPVAVTGVTLDQATMALTAGGATGTLVETVVPADATDKTVTWSSSVPAVATVVNGVVTPLTAGTTTITVTTVDGSLTATCEVTVEAPVTPVAPAITAIPDQVVYWDEDGWTYQVVAILGTGTTLTYSLIGNPVSMSISTTGLITWTTILDMLALHEVTVKVVDNDALFDEETFVIEVKEPLPPVPPEPLTATIWYNPTHSYVGAYTYVRGYIEAGDGVPVEVTLSEAVAETDIIQIRWNDGTEESAWFDLDLKTGETLVYEGKLNFDPPKDPITTWTACMLVCVEVQRVISDEFCPTCPGDKEIILSDPVKVDSLDPYVDLNITFDSCITSTCPTVTAAIFSFETDLTGDYCNISNCCENTCSGLASWVIENTDLCNPCSASGTTCPVEGDFPCGCLLYADSGETITYDLDFTMVDNVGNKFEDTWNIKLDTDSVVEFKSAGVVVTPVDGVYKLYGNCDPVGIPE